MNGCCRPRTGRTLRTCLSKALKVSKVSPLCPTEMGNRARQHCVAGQHRRSPESPEGQNTQMLSLSSRLSPVSAAYVAGLMTQHNSFAFLYSQFCSRVVTGARV